MIGPASSRPLLVFMTAAALLFCIVVAGAQGSAVAPSVSWDAAFPDRSGNTPLHFVAHYLDGHGASHRLEEWRVGQAHLRRKTDDRIDLHADAAARTLPGQPPDYLWQILDLQKRIAHRVSTAGMLHVGMLYSYYSMAHVLTRPAGRFTVTPAIKPLPAPAIAHVDPLVMLPHLPPCTWWQIDAPGQPATRVCWVARYGVPSETWALAPDGWHLSFFVENLLTRPLPASTFVTDTTRFQVRSVDELESDD